MLAELDSFVNDGRIALSADDVFGKRSGNTLHLEPLNAVAEERIAFLRASNGEPSADEPDPSLFEPSSQPMIISVALAGC